MEEFQIVPSHVEEHKLEAEMKNKRNDWLNAEASCPVDDSFGTLVWVRRRNGHWWPGRILAPHEVPHSTLLFPKSGTPVRLLGKDDTNVDWYNIGKSRRIKAFRCGEFDDVIERARSFGNTFKRREKYARREDAILHALELEKRQTEERKTLRGSGVAVVGVELPKSPNHGAANDDVPSSNHCEDHHGNAILPSVARKGALIIPKSPQTWKSMSTSCRIKTPTILECEDDRIPRMRNLQDFVLQIAKADESKVPCKNVYEATIVEESWKGKKKICKNAPEEGYIIEDANKVESCITRITTGVCSAPSITKASSRSVQKRKKHLENSSADECSHKKRDRRRPLNQVLKKSSNKFAVFGCENFSWPSPNVNTHMCSYWSDTTEATSSQGPFERLANGFKPQQEHKSLELKHAGEPLAYGLEQENCGYVTVTNKARTSLLPQSWDGSRWPSLMGPQVDFGMLLGTPFMDSIFEGTSACVYPGLAYTGSATSVNTANFQNSDSHKYLRHGGGNLSKSSGHDRNDGNHVGVRCRNKEVQDSDSGHAGVALPTGQSVSNWQVKRRRNLRRPYGVGSEPNEDPGMCGWDVNEDQMANDIHYRADMCMMPYRRVNASIRPYAGVNSSLQRNMSRQTASRSVGGDCERGNMLSHYVSSNSKSSMSEACRDARRHSSCWVDVKVDFSGISKREHNHLVSLFSEVMNRAVSGYPISIELLKNRSSQGAPAIRRSFHRSEADVSARTDTVVSRVPRWPTQKLPNQSKTSACKHRLQRKGKWANSSRKVGTMLQKTRMLSSIAPIEQEGALRQKLERESFNSKAPCVTCVPVHVVFDRIREVLYKQPEHNLNKACKDL